MHLKALREGRIRRYLGFMAVPSLAPHPLEEEFPEKMQR